MKSTSIVLVGLFVAQVAAAGVLYYNTMSQRSVRPQGSLLAYDSDVVDQISVQEGENTITLVKKQDDWVIESNQLPAQRVRVDQAIQTLGDMQLGWSVASSDGSHQQLEVADDKYQRRVKVSGGDATLGDIFIGTSPGFKRSHVRVADTDEVYSVAVNAFDFPTKVGEWIDKSLLQATNITSVTIDEKVLEQKDDQWVYDGNQSTDQEKVAELIKVFENLRVNDISDVAAEGLEFESVALTADGQDYDYRFAASGSDYLVARADIDSLFKISQDSYDKVVAAELLAPDPEPESEPAPESAKGEDGQTSETGASGAGSDSGGQAAQNPQPSPAGGTTEAATEPATGAKQ